MEMVSTLSYNEFFVYIFIDIHFFKFSGAAQFLQLIRSLEKEDEEVGQLGDQVRAYFLPFMTAPVPSISTNASE